MNSDFLLALEDCLFKMIEEKDNIEKCTKSYPHFQKRIIPMLQSAKRMQITLGNLKGNQIENFRF